jgi:alpha-ketoglutarate-dependent taurine dioxygenase
MRLNREPLISTLNASGAVLIRGPRLSDLRFKEIVRDLSSEPLKYVYRSTPRTDLGGGVFTATEYPAGLDIPMHNENAYQREWPLRLLFYSDQPAEGGGGQTPLANTVHVTRRISADIRKRFAEKQVAYVRTFRPDIDLPWQTVFQTTSKAEVETYCRTHDILFEWTSADTLRTRQVCQAFATHPRTGIVVWFNQAHLFHPSALDPKTRSVLKETLREEEFPRNVTYGDGSPIDNADLQNIREAFAYETVRFQWRAGDMLLVDNMLVSHGRKAYKGKRRVLVAMLDLFSPAESESRQKREESSASAGL